MGGWRVVPNAKVSKQNPTYYWGMGLTAEQVAKEYNVSREDQDAFALRSHERALNAQDNGLFEGEIVPLEIDHVSVENNKRVSSTHTVSSDEGPRRGSSLEALAKLKPVFAQGGSVTAGNSSQTSDGAAFVMVVSESFMKEHNLEPIARLSSFVPVGVHPRIMGIGPVHAVPKALNKAGLKLSDIGLIELNEAFASQSVAVCRELDLNQDIVNVNGGAIALGHPLGCSGAKLSVQLFHEAKRRKVKHGIVTMCVGTGQGAAGVFEIYN
jgi:acetyl-CoA acyltransferase